jgi:hypothetical protein
MLLMALLASCTSTPVHHVRLANGRSVAVVSLERVSGIPIGSHGATSHAVVLSYVGTDGTPEALKFVDLLELAEPLARSVGDSVIILQRITYIGGPWSGLIRGMAYPHVLRNGRWVFMSGP